MARIMAGQAWVHAEKEQWAWAWRLAVCAVGIKAAEAGPEQKKSIDVETRR